MKYDLHVAVALIEENGKYLITQRMAGKHKEGCWEFPGGKLEENETPQTALAREIQEEIGVTIEVRDFIKENVIYYPAEGHVQVRAYKCTITQGTPQKLEVANLRWATLQQITTYDTTESVQVFVNELQEKL